MSVPAPAPITAQPTERLVIDLLRVSSMIQDVNRQHSDLAKNRKRFGLASERALEVVGVPGTETLSDDEIQKVLREMERPEIAGLNISSLDRLFRPAKDPGQFAILVPFKKHRKIIWSAREGEIDINTTEGYQKALTAGTQGAVELMILTERSVNGQIDVLRGKPDAETGIPTHKPWVCHPSAKYGYRWINKHQPEPNRRYVVNEEQIKWVRQMFEWARGGVKPNTIARRLTELNVMSMGNGKAKPRPSWSRGVVLQILRSRVYLGELEDKGILITDPEIIPPTIDVALWEDVKRVLDGSRTRNQGQPCKNPFYELRGFLYCSRCTRRHHTHTGTGIKRTRKPFYQCGNVEWRPYKRLCPTGQVLMETIHPLVRAAIWEILSQPDVLLKQGLAYYADLAQPGTEKIKTLEAEAKHLETVRENTIYAMKQGLDSRSKCESEIREINRRLDGIRDELRAAGRVVNLPPLAQAQAAMRRIIANPPSTPEAWRGIYELLLDFKCVWDDEANEITITGSVPIPDAADLKSTGSGEKYCHGRLSRSSSTFSPIPFVINRRVAA